MNSGNSKRTLSLRERARVRGLADSSWPSPALWLKAFGAVGLVLVIALFMSLLLPSSGRVDIATVSIPSGASARRIAVILKDAEIIRSPFLFRLVARARFLSRRLHAGEYRFSTRQSLLSVVDQLIDGEVYLHPVTIPEGLRMEEVFERVEKAGLAAAPALLVLARDASFCRRLGVEAGSLEGYLAPDTYHFPKGYGDENILRAMMDRFRAGLPSDFESRARAAGLSPHQAVILASLIEEEAFDPSERGRIAAVFLNRLRKNMRLESCASISYALGQHRARLFDQDLRVVSPYNTYLHRGLPPGPICSPGKESLEAALNPETSAYLFFVAQQDGTHVFTESFEAHLKAKAKAEKKQGKGS